MQVGVSINDKTKVLRFIWTYPGLNRSHIQISVLIGKRRIVNALKELQVEGAIRVSRKKCGDSEAEVYYPALNESEEIIRILDEELPYILEKLKQNPVTSTLAEKMKADLEEFEKGGFDNGESESEITLGSISGDNDDGKADGVEKHPEEV
ncbi:hypothetical protein DXT63_07570 [Thermoanaerobacteraceae bacterium SP2]|nr:hypothetical protein DXT63_07570 [Thermoanaerobacteraceae bacterium SP2]